MESNKAASSNQEQPTTDTIVKLTRLSLDSDKNPTNRNTLLKFVLAKILGVVSMEFCRKHNKELDSQNPPMQLSPEAIQIVAAGGPGAKEYAPLLSSLIRFILSGGVSKQPCEDEMKELLTGESRKTLLFNVLPVDMTTKEILARIIDESHQFDDVEELMGLLPNDFIEFDGLAESLLPQTLPIILRNFQKFTLVCQQRIFAITCCAKLPLLDEPLRTKYFHCVEQLLTEMAGKTEIGALLPLFALAREHPYLLVLVEQFWPIYQPDTIFPRDNQSIPVPL